MVWILVAVEIFLISYLGFAFQSGKMRYERRDIDRKIAPQEFWLYFAVLAFIALVVAYEIWKDLSAMPYFRG